VTVRLTRDAGLFAQRATTLLEAHVENNVLATVLAAVRERPRRDVLFATVEDPAAGGVVAAALRTPPRPMLCTALRPQDADELIAAWLTEDRGLPGVNAVTAAARALADAWAARTGGAITGRMQMAMHVLERVSDPPRPAPGMLRAAASADVPVLTDWWQAFAAEAGVPDDAYDAEQVVRARIAAATALVWEDGGSPVSLVATHPAVAGVSRIGPVYTPPQSRRRGYASSAVAAASRRLLAGGSRRCALFTDLGNPTSNKIYREVGYRPICTHETVSFTPQNAGMPGACG
jgi:predicted GNAT family acetyltransferase